MAATSPPRWCLILSLPVDCFHIFFIIISLHDLHGKDPVGDEEGIRIQEHDDVCNGDEIHTHAQIM